MADESEPMQPTGELPTVPMGGAPVRRDALPRSEQSTVPLSAQPTVGLDPRATVPTHLAPTQGTISTAGMQAGITPGTVDRKLPEIIGGYRRLRLLGSGGMAQVFEAEHTTLSRKVALKLLKPTVADSADFSLRFLRESHAMAQVSHPNVVAIYDAGETDGLMYMALELVTGGDLHKLLKRRGRLAVDDALGYLIGCAKGLDAIHQAGLVHRDIKPANIFLDKDGTPKMGDLGLARAADGEDRMTMTGNSWGTPSYMSPEQVKGVADLDIRADIYSLGATLYTLLIGVEPYVGETSYVITHKVLTEPPPDPRLHDQTIPPQIAAIIVKAMAKDRTRRYQTPRELLEDLERARGGQRLLHTAATAAPPPAAAPAPRSSQAEVAAAVLASAKPTTAKAAGRGVGIVPLILKGLAAVAVVGILWLVWRSMQGTTFTGTRTSGSERPAWAVSDGIDDHGRFAEAIVGGQPLRLRWCPPGTFTMGSPEGEAGRQPWENAHVTTVSEGFWMLSTEVTQGLYEALMNDNPSSTRGATLPVEGVSLDEAQAFCTRLATLGLSGARLPREREWEMACRAGENGPFAASPTPNEQGWMAPPALVQLWRESAPDEAEDAAIRWVAQHVGDGDLGIKPVGALSPNRFGLFDLHGNVMEWCSDSWDGQSPYPEGPAADAGGDLAIVRGGCWFYPPERCRSASRQGLPPSATLNYVGFRVVVPDPGTTK
jgi:eukaryotic-like serine/threonine-protein kinase